MNTYQISAVKECEAKIAQLVRSLETENQVEVGAVNFKKQAMCDKDEQKIKTWDIELFCKIVT